MSPVPPAFSPVLHHDGSVHTWEALPASTASLVRFRGRGVFETLLAHRGRPVAFDAHWERLQRGATILELVPPAGQDVRKAVGETLEAACLPADGGARLRLVLLDDAPSGFFVEVTPLEPVEPSIRMVTLPYCRNERSALAGIKSLNCGESLVALAWAGQHQAQEGLFTNTSGHVCEGIWSNLFCLDGKTLLTPSLSSGCLPGVTRQTVLQLARAAGMDVREENLSPADLPAMDALFLTSSLKGIQPVDTLDGHTYSASRPPALTQLQADYARWLDEVEW